MRLDAISGARNVSPNAAGDLVLFLVVLVFLQIRCFLLSGCNQK